MKDWKAHSEQLTNHIRLCKALIPHNISLWNQPRTNSNNNSQERSLQQSTGQMYFIATGYLTSDVSVIPSPIGWLY